MIFGIGVDTVSIARVCAMHARWGARLERRIMAAQERAALPAQPAARVRRLALGLAAKEALSKALGTGLRWPVSWQQIALRRNAAGAPQYALGAQLDAYLTKQGINRAHLTLSDDNDMAVAVTVLEK